MGMYTEILIKVDVYRELPDEVRAVLHHLFNDAPQPEKLPDHNFFKLPRWSLIGSCSSYYHIPWSTSCYKENYIFSRSDLKNYDDEITNFFDWLKPYINHNDGDCIGYSWCEEDIAPTLIYK